MTGEAHDTLENHGLPQEKKEFAGEGEQQDGEGCGRRSLISGSEKGKISVGKKGSPPANLTIPRKCQK